MLSQITVDNTEIWRGADAEADIALYVHWPFCLKKCPYCDFNSHVRENVDHAVWRKALVAELRYYARLIGHRRLKSIFFGGGTPSLMVPDTVAAVIDAAMECFDPADDIEITLEANPTSVEAGRFAAYKQAGVNRVSLGVQSLDDKDLLMLGRQHNAAEALDALDIAARHFDRFSFDLIYARPGQSMESWRTELSRALEYSGGHMSLYQLTIEPGTAFYTMCQRGDLVMPDDDSAGQMYELTQDMMDAAGLPAYEISNHASPGHESRHNLVYWRYGDYVGIGPGAHGRLTLDYQRRGTRAHSAPEIWLKRVDEQGHGAHPFETITPAQQTQEYLMMGLRLAEGVSLQRLQCLGGAKLAEILDMGAVERLRDGGFLAVDATTIKATNQGRQRLDAMLGMLIA